MSDFLSAMQFIFHVIHVYTDFVGRLPDQEETRKQPKTKRSRGESLDRPNLEPLMYSCCVKYLLNFLKLILSPT